MVGKTLLSKGKLRIRKITMTTPLVEMDGDEMTRILWQMIKDELLIPFIDLKTEYYDLGLEERNRTDDQVTVESAKATMKYGVAVKCATITPNAARMTEYNLKVMWKSPIGTIRAMLDGTVYRAPIVVKGIEPNVKTWAKPITIARHAYGDVYKATEMKVAGPGKAELVFTAEDAEEWNAKGEKVVLVRLETSPEDITGMKASQGILTVRGGMTSHAAEVARGMGTCCVSGCGAISIDEEAKQFTLGGYIFTEGDYISLDGSSGKIYKGDIMTVEATVFGNF